MKKLFLVATETSGDFLGSKLLQHLHVTAPNLKCFGVGGDGMIEQGLDPIYRVSDFNVMGLVEVLSKLKQLKRQFNRLVAWVRREKPDAIVLIDAPDFNMRFAKAVADLKIPIIYYVGPQVWAWRPQRAAQLADLVDHILLLFPFEAPFYENLPVKTTVVGHPLIDELSSYKRDVLVRKELGFDAEQPLIVLAPGSRKREISSLFPVMVEVIRSRPNWQFGVALAPTIERTVIMEMLGDLSSRVRLGSMRAMMAQADVGVVASGTATLEAGLMGIPMVVGYRLSSLTYLLARRLVKIPYVALVNIVLNEYAVPELIQQDYNTLRVLSEVDVMIENHEQHRKVCNRLKRIPDVLGGVGASERAAHIVAGYLNL